MKNTRITEILVGSKWNKVDPMEIKKGMEFRMFEPDYTPVVDIKGETNFVANSDAFYDESGVITVHKI